MDDISAADFIELKRWLESDPEVPEGMWFKRFNRFTLVGEGAIPKTFLTPGMVPRGHEVRGIPLEHGKAEGSRVRIVAPGEIAGRFDGSPHRTANFVGVRILVPRGPRSATSGDCSRSTLLESGARARGAVNPTCMFSFH